MDKGKYIDINFFSSITYISKYCCKIIEIHHINRLSSLHAWIKRAGEIRPYKKSKSYYMNIKI